MMHSMDIGHIGAELSIQEQKVDTYFAPLYGAFVTPYTRAPIPHRYLNTFLADDRSCSPFSFAPSPTPSSVASISSATLNAPTPDSAYSPSNLSSDELATPSDCLPFPAPPIAVPTKPAPIPKARNAFIMFRSHYIASGQASGTRSQNDISKNAATVWRSMSEEDKREWKEQAEIERRVRLERPDEFEREVMAARARGKKALSRRGKERDNMTRTGAVAFKLEQRKLAEKARKVKNADSGKKKTASREKRVPESLASKLPSATPSGQSRIQMPSFINGPLVSSPRVGSAPIVNDRRPLCLASSLHSTPDIAEEQQHIYDSPLDASWPATPSFPPLNYFSPTPSTVHYYPSPSPALSSSNLPLWEDPQDNHFSTNYPRQVGSGMNGNGETVEQMYAENQWHLVANSIAKIDAERAAAEPSLGDQPTGMSRAFSRDVRRILSRAEELREESMCIDPRVLMRGSSTCGSPSHATATLSSYNVDEEKDRIVTPERSFKDAQLILEALQQFPVKLQLPGRGASSVKVVTEEDRVIEGGAAGWESAYFRVMETDAF